MTALSIEFWLLVGKVAARSSVEKMRSRSVARRSSHSTWELPAQRGALAVQPRRPLFLHFRLSSAVHRT